MKKRSLFCAVGLVAGLVGHSASAAVDVTCTRPSHIYDVGEKAVFEIGQTCPGVPITVSVVEGNSLTQALYTAMTVTPVRVAYALARPGFIRCHVRTNGTDGAQGPAFLAGAAFEPHRLKPTLPPPEDFDKFWTEAFRELESIPEDLRTRDLGDGLRLISCATANGKRQYAFLYLPPGPGPHPITINVDGGEAWRTVEIARKEAEGARAQHRGFLHFHLPPYEPREDDGKAYHKAWLKENRELVRKFPYYQRFIYENLDREPRDLYFYPCILGCCRLIDIAVRDPRVDRAAVTYEGGSHGGGFGIFLAAFSPHIRAAYCGVPNFGNLAGELEGRAIGIGDKPLREAWQKLRYYDASYCARRITVPVFMDVGFIDESVPPDSVYTIYNQLRGPKFIFNKLTDGHSTAPALRNAILRDWRANWQSYAADPAGHPASAAVDVTCTRPSHIYDVGEKAVFEIGQTCPGVPITVNVVEGHSLTQALYTAVTVTPVRVAYGLDRPGFIRCHVRTNGTDGAQGPAFLAGAAFEPHRLKTTLPPPEDFDKFWTEAFRELESIPEDLRTRDLGDGLQMLSCATANGKRQYAFLYLPPGPGPHPIRVLVPGGEAYLTVKSSRKYAETARAQHRGFLHIHLPPYEPREDDGKAYHKAWLKENRELVRKFPYYQRFIFENLDREPRDLYFYPCILGCCRLIDIAVRDPRVDRAAVTYASSSHGGGFGIFLAAFSPHIRAAYCGVPNFGNLAGEQEGRAIGTSAKPLREAWQKLRYYDAAYCARRITVPVFMDVGFIDESVPPDSVYTIYNQLRGPKFIFNKLTDGHSTEPALCTEIQRSFRVYWSSLVAGPGPDRPISSERRERMQP